MPEVLARILDLLADPNSQMAELAEALSHDQALVARLIAVSNSALYGGSHEISSVNQAVVRLGTRTIRSLVVAASTRTLFPADATHVGVTGHELWQHSVECGLTSRRVASTVRYADPEEAFVGGVLHDVGKVVMLLNLSDEYRRVLKLQASSGSGSVAAEAAVLGFDHTMVGELLLDRWNMPDVLTACVRHHHDPDAAGEHAALARIVACGNYLGHAHGTLPDGATAEAGVAFAEHARSLGIAPDQMTALHERVVEDLESSHVLA